MNLSLEVHRGIRTMYSIQTYKKYLFIPIIEFSKYKYSLFLLVSKAFG